MKRLNHAEISAKSVEVSKSLINKGAGLYTYDLDITRSIGDAARLAANIRQRGSIKDEQLAATATALKQDYSYTRSDLLPILEELNWIEIRKDGRKIRRVDEHIPPVGDILGELGELWEEQEPTDVDSATINSLSLLNESPATKDALLSEIGSEKGLENALNYGIQANYFGTFDSFETGNTVIWTPHYWSGKVDEVIRFLNRQSDENFKRIESITRRIKNYPGTPIEKVERRDINTINAGIAHGFFPSVEVKDRRGIGHEFVFAATPHFEIEPKKDVFEKARMIVSCIRHGQYHAEITKIKYPSCLLQALKNNTINPHSYAKIQYALLILNGICTYTEVKRSYGTLYKPIFIKTPENRIAMNIAEELLKGKEPVSGTVREPEVEQLLTKGVYSYSSEMRQIKSKEEIIAKKEFDRLLESIQGSGIRG